MAVNLSTDLNIGKKPSSFSALTTAIKGNSKSLPDFSLTNRKLALQMVQNGTMSRDEANRLLASPIKRIEASEVSGGNTTNNTSSSSVNNSYNAQLAAANALKAKRTSEAQNIKNSILGKRNQFGDILKDILGNIDKTYEEEVGKLSENYDRDKAELIDTLADAIPEIGNSFAAIGAYDSSQRAMRNADTREEEAKAEEDLTRQFEDNKANMGNKRNTARNEAQNAYNNFMIDFDTLKDTEANSDNLESLRQSQNSLLKGLSDFGSQKNIFKPGSTFANELSVLNKYDATKAKDALSNFLASAGASGITANTGTGSIANAGKQNSNKKQESEIEVNQKTGVK